VTYYVDTASTAGGTGTTTATTGADRAWATIAEVNAFAFDAGDSILFARGCTWRETLTVPSSGSEGLPITFGAYGSGANPIIDGSAAVSSWTLTGSRDVLNETFQGTGYSTSWDLNVGAGSTADPDNTDIASPVPGSTQLFKSVRGTASFNAEIYNQISSADILYTSFYVRVDASNISVDGHTQMLVHGYDVGWGDVWDFMLVVYSGVLYFQTWFWEGGGGLKASAAINTDQWYWVEIKWDITNHAYYFKLGSNPSDAAIQQGAGTITDAHAGALNRLVVNGGADAHSNTIYFGNIWIGSAATTTTNVWQAAVTTEPAIVFINGTTIGTKKASVALLTTENDWFWAANVLYFYKTSAPTNVEVGARDKCIEISAPHSYLTFQDLTLQKANYYNFKYDVSGTSAGIILQRLVSKYARNDGAYIRQAHAAQYTTGVTVDGCTFSYNGESGLNIVNRIDGILVKNNIAHHNTWSADHNSAGLKFYGVVTDNVQQNVNMKNLVIEHNEVYSQAVGDPVWPNSPGMGIYLDTVGNGAIVRYNKVYNNAKVGIMSEVGDSNLIYYNLVYGNGFYDGQLWPEFGISVFRNSTHVGVYNNVVYGNSAGIEVSGWSECDPGDSPMIANYVKNNISVGNTNSQLIAKYGGENDGTMGSANTYLNNSLGVEAAGFVEWGSTVMKATYDAWETAYGGTTASVEADPLFVSTSDFHLQAASPARGAGVAVGLTTDYLGSTVPKNGSVDLGAYEYPSGLAVLTGS